MKLHTYFRSSASFRVRIALNLKGLDVEQVPVDLTRNGGRQLDPAFRSVSPDAVVPALVTDAGDALVQSLAICEWLDETYPDPPLLPRLPIDRARARAIALTIACEIHPLNNTRVLKYVKHDLGAGEERKNAWYRHWVERGLTSVETMVGASGAGAYCVGDAPTLADIFLVPQIFNARRFDCRLDHVPTLMRVFDACMQLDAFDRAQPSRQPDAV